MSVHNNVRLIGRIGSDIDIRTFDSGSQKANFSFAVPNGKDKDTGERKTTWITVEAWGSQAKYLQEYANKGDSLAVEGELQIDNYETAEGEKRQKMYVKAYGHSGVTLLSSKGSGSSEKEEAPAPAAKPKSKKTVVPDDDDLPPF